MVFQPLHAMSSLRISRLSSHRAGSLATRLGSGLLALSLSLGMALPTFAADPFRTSNSHEIGDLTEDAFEAIFKRGDYKEAELLLARAETAEADEPLVQAMLASIAYLNGEFAQVSQRAESTKKVAQALESKDPLRSHLYQAVGIFMEGASVLQSQGVARGTPTALSMLQQVFNHMDAAEAIDPTDPELNLLKGYMDLMLAVNLPFSNPDEAIASMEQYGQPAYLSQRGIAIGYRDLDRNEEALAAVNKAIEAASNAPNQRNPELLYLKAQLLLRLNRDDEGAALFREALDYRDQLPETVTQRIVHEACAAEGADRYNCSLRADEDK